MSWWAFVLLYTCAAVASLALLYYYGWARPSRLRDPHVAGVSDVTLLPPADVAELRENVRDVMGVRAMFLQAMGEQVERQDRLIGDVAVLRATVADLTERLAKAQSDLAELRQLPKIKQMRREAEVELLQDLFAAGNGNA